jgi:hypothetical protein
VDPKSLTFQEYVKLAKESIKKMENEKAIESTCFSEDQMHTPAISQ